MLAEERIRVIVLAAVLRPGDHALLAFRGFNPSKTQHFYRPLGGGVEFGESSEQALQREMLEELGVAVRTLRKLGTLENRFVYDGGVGHELVIVWLTEFLDPALYLEPTLPYIEGDQLDVAEWVQPASLRAQGIPLYPNGLAELLQEV